MFGPGPLFARLVVDECFHAYGDKGERRLVMNSVQVGVGRDFWIGVALVEEEELSFRLGDDLVPEADGESAGRATKDGDEVVFPELDAFSVMLLWLSSGRTSW